jgi:hypothetical protein
VDFLQSLHKPLSQILHEPIEKSQRSSVYLLNAKSLQENFKMSHFVLSQVIIIGIGLLSESSDPMLRRGFGWREYRDEDDCGEGQVQAQVPHA